MFRDMLLCVAVARFKEARMGFRNLWDFVEALEKNGELVRVKVPVDPILEIAQITDVVSKAGGPALLFENVPGAKMPLLINAFGSMRRMAMALGVEDVEAVAAELKALLELEIPSGFLDKLRMLPRLARLASYSPEVVDSGECKEVVQAVAPSLSDLPILQCWPDDAGRFITFPQVYMKRLSNGRTNVGLYRMQLYDDQTTGLHCHIHHDGAEVLQEYRRAGRRMEVAVAIGGDPVLTYVAASPLPPLMDEMLFAGFLRKEKVRLVRCETVDLKVPANADVVLEGYVDPHEVRVEGPFGDHTGFYSLADQYPVFHLTCMTHKRSPVYLTTIVGRPPMEDAYIGRATVRIFLPLIRAQLPEVVDINLPVEGGFHNLAIVAIDKRYPFHARKVMHALWGLGQLMLTKIIVVVDAGVNVCDAAEVVWKVVNNIDPERDITFVQGPVDILDHASRLPMAGSKMGIDATRKWPEEGFHRPWPGEIRMSPAIVERVQRRWKEYGLPWP